MEIDAMIALQYSTSACSDEVTGMSFQAFQSADTKIRNYVQGFTGVDGLLVASEVGRT